MVFRTRSSPIGQRAQRVRAALVRLQRRGETHNGTPQAFSPCWPLAARCPAVTTWIPVMERALWDHVPSICKVRPRACGDVLDSRKDVSPVKERQPPIEFRRWCASIRSSQRAEGCIASAEIILVLNGKADLHAGTHVRSLVLGAEN